MLSMHPPTLRKTELMLTWDNMSPIHGSLGTGEGLLVGSPWNGTGLVYKMERKHSATICLENAPAGKRKRLKRLRGLRKHWKNTEKTFKNDTSWVSSRGDKMSFHSWFLLVQQRPTEWSQNTQWPRDAARPPAGPRSPEGRGRNRIPWIRIYGVSKLPDAPLLTQNPKP